jgi:uncharacterized membrane protein YgdD (TMEM256/DUF423 family)
MVVHDAPLHFHPLASDMKDRTLAWACGVLLLAVALGAFGAHGIQGRVDAQAYHNWSTASQYQFYHGLALLGLAAFQARFAPRTVGFVRTLFLLGMLCFCGSLYLLATREMLGTQALTRILGPITPLGGLMFMGGWAVLLVAALRRS